MMLSIYRYTQAAALVPCTGAGGQREQQQWCALLHCSSGSSSVHAACAGRQPVFSSVTEDTGAGLYRMQCPAVSWHSAFACMHISVFLGLLSQQSYRQAAALPFLSCSVLLLLLTHTYTQRRCVQSELTDWGRNPPDGCCLESCEPITHWTIIMAGPEGSAGLPRLYEGEVFRWVGWRRRGARRVCAYVVFWGGAQAGAGLPRLHEGEVFRWMFWGQQRCFKRQ